MTDMAEAAVLGWRVIRVSTGQVASGYAIDVIIRAIEAIK